MLKSERSFIESVLSESNSSTRENFIKYCNLPFIFERTLLEYYVEGIIIKEIAARHYVDDRTAKRWKKDALNLAEEHFKSNIRCHFNTTK